MFSVQVKKKGSRFVNDRKEGTAYENSVDCVVKLMALLLVSLLGSRVPRDSDGRGPV